MYLANKVIQVDEATGLNLELRFVGLHIDAEQSTIKIKWVVSLVSPTGFELRRANEGEFIRHNTETRQRYEELKQSEVGQGIIALLQAELANYPNFEQKEE